jgi:hypothetical protein
LPQNERLVKYKLLVEPFKNQNKGLTNTLKVGSKNSVFPIFDLIKMQNPLARLSNQFKSTIFFTIHFIKSSFQAAN